MTLPHASIFICLLTGLLLVASPAQASFAEVFALNALLLYTSMLTALISLCLTFFVGKQLFWRIMYFPIACVALTLFFNAQLLPYFIPKEGTSLTWVHKVGNPVVLSLIILTTIGIIGWFTRVYKHTRTSLETSAPRLKGTFTIFGALMGLTYAFMLYAFVDTLNFSLYSIVRNIEYNFPNQTYLLAYLPIQGGPIPFNLHFWLLALIGPSLGIALILLVDFLPRYPKIVVSSLMVSVVAAFVVVHKDPLALAMALSLYAGFAVYIALRFSLVRQKEKNRKISLRRTRIWSAAFIVILMSIFGYLYAIEYTRLEKLATARFHTGAAYPSPLNEQNGYLTFRARGAPPGAGFTVDTHTSTQSWEEFSHTYRRAETIKVRTSTTGATRRPSNPKPANLIQPLLKENTIVFAWPDETEALIISIQLRGVPEGDIRGTHIIRPSPSIFGRWLPITQHRYDHSALNRGRLNKSYANIYLYITRP